MGVESTGTNSSIGLAIKACPLVTRLPSGSWTSHTDPPAAKRVDSSDFVQEKKREYLDQLKKEFGE